MKRIPKAKCLDPNWKYVPAVETDIGKRFRRVIAEQKSLRKERPTNVAMLKRGVK